MDWLTFVTGVSVLELSGAVEAAIYKEVKA